MGDLDEEQLRAEIRVLTDCHNQVCKQLVEEQEKNSELEEQLIALLDSIKTFTQHINRSVMAENYMLTEKSHAINNLLNDLYEAIDENYTERLENDDELGIIRAEAQLNLITSIIDEIERIQISEMLL